MYVVRIVCNAHARVMEAENSTTLTIYSSEHIFIALSWRSEMIMGFHEYTYQDREYIIRAINTKHAQCTCLYIQLVTKPWVFLLQAACTIALCHSEDICDQVS